MRGLDGDRVLIVEDGLRMGDLSSQSGDHGVNVNPASASRVEVVRGPATLLFGANAIGGLVNVITNEIPTAPVKTATGSLTADVGSGAMEGGAAGDVTVGNGTIHAVRSSRCAARSTRRPARKRCRQRSTRRDSRRMSRAARNPALEELYFHGPHPGNNVFENGDPTLQSEHALGFDASLRWRGAAASGRSPIS